MNIIEKIRDAGVVGAGGAGFPAQVKLDAKAEWLILNGAECEPLLRVDQQLCKVYGDKIVELMDLVAKHLGAIHSVIGIKAKHKEAIEQLEKYCKDSSCVSVFPLEDFYPAGDEQILVAEITGKAVPELGIPLAVGVVVINVETLINVGNALMDIPVTDTCVTVTGQVPNPITCWLPVGISYREALFFAGAENLEDMVALDGGPMMGRVVTDFSKPIKKTTKGIILLPKSHYLIAKKTMTVNQTHRISRGACEQCRMCTDLCPRYLIGHNMEPHKLMRKLSYNDKSLEDTTIAQLCSECNLCELYACPVGIAPRAINVEYKVKLGAQGIRHIPRPNRSIPEVRAYRKTPVKRLIMRLGIGNYDVPAPFTDIRHLSNSVNILLKQHVGVAAIPVVKLGQHVCRGEVIGDIPLNGMGARIHASIDGIVTIIDDERIVICGK